MSFPRQKSLWILEGISFFFVFLFLYAAVSKLLDYELFRAQLGQFPFISSYANWLTWVIPSAEIFIALLFFSYSYRLAGLFASLGLVLVFTTYIIALLHFSESAPCSCGGVLTLLSWEQHLLLNVICIALAVIGIIFLKKKKKEIKLVNHTNFTVY